MHSYIVSIAVAITSGAGYFYPLSLPIFFIGSIASFLYLLRQHRNRDYLPKSVAYKELEKIKKRRARDSDKKHKYITDQLEHISDSWGYTMPQRKIVDRFLQERLYGDIYNRLTSSLLPNIISLIDYCNSKEKKGCKREVSKRVNDVTVFMSKEVKKKKIKNSEKYEVTLEVYDKLLQENYINKSNFKI